MIKQKQKTTKTTHRDFLVWSDEITHWLSIVFFLCSIVVGSVFVGFIDMEIIKCDDHIPSFHNRRMRWEITLFRVFSAYVINLYFSNRLFIFCSHKMAFLSFSLSLFLSVFFFLSLNYSAFEHGNASTSHWSESEMELCRPFCVIVQNVRKVAFKLSL